MVYKVTGWLAGRLASWCLAFPPPPPSRPTILLSHTHTAPAAQIRHPHIVNLLEVMSSREKIFMVLELVTGGELFDKVVAEGPMKVRRNGAGGVGHKGHPCMHA